MSMGPIRSHRDIPETPSNSLSISKKVAMGTLITVTSLLTLVTGPIRASGWAMWYLGRTCTNGVQYLHAIATTPSKSKLDAMEPHQSRQAQEKHKEKVIQSREKLISSAKELGKAILFMIPGVASIAILKTNLSYKLTKK
ncbi:hypothetical protein CLAVI_000796 [Candidatus Clavichlamydia salmonicola]|uniref:hypothetical protein n=1 Tax=Candidatus Clavichlamydia salmonicola TaxID=469812 RepID=UPI0018914879|nr:hypothetical protein [Candidatus Clavichlamydia salmonicola]MBF5051160.1 hypothetical protein [Candidatus Clavichlamydia salmonicola]